MSVVLGAHNIYKTEASQQLIEVAKYFPHPDFKDYDNDIMLLKVSANLQHDSKNDLKSINQLASKGNILHFAASLIHFCLLSVELTPSRLTYILKVAVKCECEVCISTAILRHENSLTEEKMINSSTLKFFLLIFSCRRKPN